MALKHQRTSQNVSVLCVFQHKILDLQIWLKNYCQSGLKQNINQSRSFSIECIPNQDETYDSNEFTGTVSFKEGSMSNNHKENLILLDPSKFDKEFSLKNIPSITPSCISINVRIINMLENYIKE